MKKKMSKWKLKVEGYRSQIVVASSARNAIRDLRSNLRQDGYELEGKLIRINAVAAMFHFKKPKYKKTYRHKFLHVVRLKTDRLSRK